VWHFFDVYENIRQGRGLGAQMPVAGKEPKKAHGRTGCWKNFSSGLTQGRSIGITVSVLGFMGRAQLDREGGEASKKRNFLDALGIVSRREKRIGMTRGLNLQTCNREDLKHS